MNDLPCRQLDDYLARGLTASEQAAFVAHLDDCAACRHAAAEAEHLSRLLRRAVLEATQLPDMLVARIQDRVRGSRRCLTARWAAVAAAAMVLAIFGVWWIVRDQAGNISETQAMI